MRIEWHPEAVADLAALGTEVQRRIRNALRDLSELDDARRRLAPHSDKLKGFWKLRVGDHRLVCAIEDRAGKMVLVILVAHRSIVYARRGVRRIADRGGR